VIAHKLEHKIREIKDFPKQGINFKDITPLLADPSLSSQVIEAFKEKLKSQKIDAILGVESRGFLFGMMLANELNIPFIPVRKAGKLPAQTISEEYSLEYGTASIEIHVDALKKGWNVVIHDDLLATGGTAKAAANLVQRLGAKVSAFLFIVELSFLEGREPLRNYSKEVFSLVNY
jgi:adenine phosphoribosyltransferase